jgi:hypothetical protein
MSIYQARQNDLTGSIDDGSPLQARFRGSNRSYFPDGFAFKPYIPPDQLPAGITF